ncbi:capsid protein [Lysobacter enzymogenes]|uniref:S49 family peptidase n=1 Tax=Lysobacter enzymogenes TaxID=69 RepID=UPI0019D01C72|nr:S49 family peptidase [Lysobacter enzymogenes]MBN7138993.1 capsid protein [Lysobacter enzymogenes]
MKSFTRLQNLIFNVPLFVRPDALNFVANWAEQAMQLNVVNSPGAQLFSDDADPAAQMRAQDDRRQALVAETGVEVLGIHGLLVARTMNMNPCEQTTSYENLRRELQRSLADPMVEHIVLDIDSPGGSAAGAFELAEDIFAARQVKPITAVTNFSAYSGGYLLGAAATEMVISETGGLGSIGVIARHADFSKRNESMGVSVTTVFAGAHKNDLSPHEPLTEQSMVFLQDMVNTSYERFVAAVARFRGMPEQAVRATEANVFFGQRAIDIGLADRLEPPQAAVNRIAGAVQAARASRAAAPPRRITHQARAMALANQS